jgi:hypothetical protein
MWEGTDAMFYELIGILLTRGGVALSERHGPNASDDERNQREFRQIALLMRRLGAVWPQLFKSLAEESEILSTTLNRLRAPLSRAGVAVPAAVDECPDPLERYRLLARELERAVIALHEHHRDRWAAEALHELRRGLADAAEVQGRLVDLALAT